MFLQARLCVWTSLSIVWFTPVATSWETLLNTGPLCSGLRLLFMRLLSPDSLNFIPKGLVYGILHSLSYGESFSVQSIILSSFGEVVCLSRLPFWFGMHFVWFNWQMCSLFVSHIFLKKLCCVEEISGFRIHSWSESNFVSAELNCKAGHTPDQHKIQFILCLIIWVVMEGTGMNANCHGLVQCLKL